MKSEDASEESPVSKLNDDCLINIFKQLSPKDRIVMEKGMQTKLICKTDGYKSNALKQASTKMT